MTDSHQSGSTPDHQVESSFCTIKTLQSKRQRQAHIFMVVVHEMIVERMLRGILGVLPQYPLHVGRIAPTTHCCVDTGNIIQDEGLRNNRKGMEEGAVIMSRLLSYPLKCCDHIKTTLIPSKATINPEHSWEHLIHHP